MAVELVESQALKPHHLREYILDMLQQLAAMAAEHQDPATAGTIWSCWSALSTQGAPTAGCAPSREGSNKGEVVALWADGSGRPRK